MDIDNSLSTEEILERLKIVKEKRLTNAAVLLFGKNPQELFLQTVIKYNVIVQPLKGQKTIDDIIIAEKEPVFLI